MTFLRTIGGQGGAPGKFNSPQGLDVDDETGNIFVADTGNDRVQVRGPTEAASSVVRPIHDPPPLSQILTKSGRFQRFIGGKMVKGERQRV